ncbi:Shikimate kinase II [Methanosarcina mazei TMA]|nr:Shikimate kinase II [Methanosarcina mazei TMA]
MGCENMDKRKKVSKRNYFRIKHYELFSKLIISLPAKTFTSVWI